MYFIKNAFYNSLVWLVACSSIRAALQRQRLTILMYHGIVDKKLPVDDWCFLPKKAFYRQMQYLKRHFEVVPLSQALTTLQRGTLRHPLAAITFDDGYQSNFAVAFPILKRLNLPATIFLNTAFIGTENTLWFCRLVDILTRTPADRVEFNNQFYALSSPELRAQASKQIQESLKSLTPQQTTIQLRQLAKQLKTCAKRKLERDSPFRMLTPEQIKTMAESGLIEFGAHTHRHPILSVLAAEQQREEIELSISKTSELSGRTCTLFAYPNGRKQDFTQQTVKLLNEYGIEAAVTTVEEPNDSTTPKLELGRYSIGSSTGFGEFLGKIHHIQPLLKSVPLRQYLSL